MKSVFAIALLAACGGGPSVGGEVDESTRIVDSACQVTPDMEVTVDVTYQTSMNVGQNWEGSILILGDIMTSKLDSFSCDSWTPLGAGQSARGCTRSSEDQPESQAINHTQIASFQSLPTNFEAMVVGDVKDAQGDFSITQDFESVSCFFAPPP